jgi:hypothetical protein
MMTFVLLLAAASATLTTIASLFATGSENETDGRKFDFWASPDPFLYMSTVWTDLWQLRGNTIPADGLSHPPMLEALKATFAEELAQKLRTPRVLAWILGTITEFWR